MSKSMNMLRTRRRDNNVKPNRRLDRKSSRGMIYENEELRLKTININAEVERGQSDIKKLRRENELLKKEIWYMRDEYEKLEKLFMKEKDKFSSSSTCSSSDSDSTISEDSKEVETTQNLENVQKTNMKNLQAEFDHLSVVPEEPSPENSDKSRTSFPEQNELLEEDNNPNMMLPPDQSYPDSDLLFPRKHFFAPLPSRPLTPPITPHFYTFRNNNNNNSTDSKFPLPPPQSRMVEHLQLPGPGPSLPPGNFENLEKLSEGRHVDLIVKTDNRNFLEALDPMQRLEFAADETYREMYEENLDVCPCPCPMSLSADEIYPGQGHRLENLENSRPRSSFSNGGNLEELLNDIQTISEDILKISSPPPSRRIQGHLEELKEQNDSMLDLTTGHYPLDRSTFNGHLQSLDRLTEEGEGESPNKEHQNGDEKFKTEISLVLMPTPMPLLELDKKKYQNLNSGGIPDCSNLDLVSPQELLLPPREMGQQFVPKTNSDFRGLSDGPSTNLEFGLGQFSSTSDNFKIGLNDRVGSSSREDLLDKEEIPKTNFEKEEKTENDLEEEDPKKDKPKDKLKMSVRRKLSIHFKGRKDKQKKKNEEEKEKDKNKELKLPPPSLTISAPSSPSVSTSTTSATPTLNSDLNPPPQPNPITSSFLPQNSIMCPQHSSDSDRPKSNKHNNKSTSASPERHDGTKKHHKHKKKKKTKNDTEGYLSRRRRNTLSTDGTGIPGLVRERSVSICTDRSNLIGYFTGETPGGGLTGTNSCYMTDDYLPSSERERTNSLSSTNTNNPNVDRTRRGNRKFSNISHNIPNASGGKIPWCACWGNGCL